MPAPGRPGRPRSPRAHRAVLEAVIHLLGDRGLAGMSVEAVADRAGVSKATIYRHWSSKEALCVEAVACVVVESPAPRGEDPRGELRSLLLGVAAALERSDAGRLLPHLASAAATDPQLAQVWRLALVDPTHRRVAACLHRALDVGALSPDADPDLLAEFLLAPLFYRRLVTGRPARDGALIDDLLDGVWRAWPPAGGRGATA